MYKADLAGTNLTGANLREADLTDANLKGVNFTDADLSYASLDYSYYDSATIFPEGFDLTTHKLRYYEGEPPM
jgi:uncharacterized protein YjbI with pentapeptide repeats